MAIELTQDVINRIHANLETTIPLQDIRLFELTPYYQAPDYNWCDIPLVGGYQDFITEFIISLLILAAEEELDDYPMEASNEIS